MGFKIKTLGAAFRPFTANIGPLNLTAGVPIAELYFGLYGVSTVTANNNVNFTLLLNQIDEVTVTRGGQTVVSIENGQDLLALMMAPWNDQAPQVTDCGSSGHYYYVKGLCLPTSYPSGASGEFQLTVENAGSALTSGELLSIAEGQGLYAANYFSQEHIDNKMFHIAKRLYTPLATGWHEGINIGTEGILIGMLVWQTHEQDKGQVITGIDLYQSKLDIGGEEVIVDDCLTAPATAGKIGAVENNPRVSFASHVLGEYRYYDFRRQPWDCRGKSVVYSWNAGTATTGSVRCYPIYLVDW
jgi:hypothetical protein